MRVARLKGREQDFARLGIDPSKAFNPVQNIIELESILFDDTNVRSRMIKVLSLSCDRHIILYKEETTKEYVRKFFHSLAVVSAYSFFS